MITFTSEQLEKLEKFNKVVRSGCFVNGRQLVYFYNKIMNTKKAVTNCATCLSNMLNTLNISATAFKKYVDEQEAKEKENKPEEVKKKGRPKKGDK